MATNAALAEKPVKTDRQPRAKAGRFDTSEAAKRRKAAGIDPKASKGGMAAGVSAIIAELEPAVSSEIRTEAARNIANVVTITKGLTVGLIDKVRQSLEKNEGIRTIVATVPDAAKYVQRLVRGEEVGAPHAIRLQAALAVFDISGARLEITKDDRDLSELSLEELNQRVMQADHEISARIAIPGESTEVGNAAPLPPESPIIDSPTPSDQRQAID